MVDKRVLSLFQDVLQLLSEASDSRTDPDTFRAHCKLVEQRIMAHANAAQQAYAAYSASTGNKNFRGEEMPAWEELPPAIQAAWNAAADAVR